jgi:hypothetical protein
MGKGNKVADTSGLEQATREANALQERMYNQNIELAQPFYDTGVSSIGRLADLLGLQGGSTRSRDQIYQNLLPQYTSQSAVPNGLLSIGGQTFNVDKFLDPQVANSMLGIDDTGRNSLSGARQSVLANYAQSGDIESALSGYGGQLLSPVSKEITDYDALNTAVEEALKGQELPSDFRRINGAFRPYKV